MKVIVSEDFLWGEPLLLNILLIQLDRFCFFRGKLNGHDNRDCMRTMVGWRVSAQTPSGRERGEVAKTIEGKLKSKITPSMACRSSFKFFAWTHTAPNDPPVGLWVPGAPAKQNFTFVYQDYINTCHNYSVEDLSIYFVSNMNWLRGVTKLEIATDVGVWGIREDNYT